MDKPIDILEIENIYNVSLSEIAEDAWNNPNYSYRLNNEREIIGLNLSGNEITEIKGLESLTQLQRFWLYDNQITEIKGLGRLSLLQDLNLSNNQIQSRESLKYIASLQSLKTIDIKGNKFPEALSNLTVGQIREYISKNHG